MKCRLLAAALTLTAAMTPAHAANIIVNGGFEEGHLSPWYNDSASGTESVPWGVTSTDAQSGSFSAVAFGNVEIRQDFAAVAISSITELSFWLRHVNAGDELAVIGLFYGDGSSSLNLIFTSGTDWEKFDLTNQLLPEKSLTGISFYGYDSGRPLQDSTYLDNVVINVEAAIPEPATWAMLIGGLGLVGASMRRRALKVSFG